jgi:DNA mismatch repair protein MutS
MNASGKSTLMKAVGIAILLAQAGCYVPAKSMKLSPFHSIYTRILNQDQLLAGLSSFAVEMSELRDILCHANSHTLVLGDELCSGTESISAQALISSGMDWLLEKHAKFIFATHLHGLEEKPGIEIWHLHVEYDPITHRLIYDRSLRRGKGSTLYGLEVARAMNLPLAFIERAMEYRRLSLQQHHVDESAPSAWNHEIVRKSCELCSASIGLEVHHIQPRASSMNQRLPNGIHVNDKRNLMVICQKCHDDIHAGNIEIKELKMTSDGPVREVHAMLKEKEKEKEKEKKKSKWTEKEQEVIQVTLKKFFSLSLKSIRAYLESTHDIRISEAKLGEFRKLL